MPDIAPEKDIHSSVFSYLCGFVFPPTPLRNWFKRYTSCVFVVRRTEALGDHGNAFFSGLRVSLLGYLLNLMCVQERVCTLCPYPLWFVLYLVGDQLMITWAEQRIQKMMSRVDNQILFTCWLLIGAHLVIILSWVCSAKVKWIQPSYFSLQLCLDERDKRRNSSKL